MDAADPVEDALLAATCRLLAALAFGTIVEIVTLCRTRREMDRVRFGLTADSSDGASSERSSLSSKSDEFLTKLRFAMFVRGLLRGLPRAGVTVAVNHEKLANMFRATRRA